LTTKTHTIHEQHAHPHGSNCGHIAVKHNGHIDYLHDGHLHFPHEGHVDEHVIETSGSNPAGCTPNHICDGHEKGHKHGAGCGHERVPHGDHVDYLVTGHLHHVDGDHCDDHGALQLA
jgi:hypothetical protein